jgi:hypothetical protein
MRVTADQVESVRALITRDTESFERIDNQLDPATAPARGALISAAFFLAGGRLFKGKTPSTAIAFVADLRAKYPLTEDFDPRIAERLLLATFTEENIDDIGDETRGEYCTLLLAGLVLRTKPSDAALDKLLDDARELADEWLAQVG